METEQQQPGAGAGVDHREFIQGLGRAVSAFLGPFGVKLGPTSEEGEGGEGEGEGEGEGGEKPASTTTHVSAWSVCLCVFKPV